MFDEQEIKQLKEVFATKDDLKSFATKDDVKSIIKEEIEGLSTMVNNAFNENEKRMADGFKEIKEEFKIVNEKLDKKVDNIEKRVVKLEEALAIK